MKKKKEDDDEADIDTGEAVKPDAESDASSASEEQSEVPDLKGETSPEPMPVETDAQLGQTEDLIPTEQPIAAETDPSMTAQPTLDPELPAATGPTQMETNNE